MPAHRASGGASAVLCPLCPETSQRGSVRAMRASCCMHVPLSILPQLGSRGVHPEVCTAVTSCQQPPCGAPARPFPGCPSRPFLFPGIPSKIHAPHTALSRGCLGGGGSHPRELVPAAAVEGSLGGILEPGVGFLEPRVDFWSPGWDSRSGLLIIQQGKCPTAGGHGPSGAAASLWWMVTRGGWVVGTAGSLQALCS